MNLKRLFVGLAVAILALACVAAFIGDGNPLTVTSLITGSLRLGGSPGTGKIVASSDANGNMVWTNAASLLNPSTMTQTNFVLNTVYSNATANPVLVSATAFLVTAAVNGDCALDLMYSTTGGANYTLAARAAIATTLAGALTLPITNCVSAVFTNLGSYYFTNTSSGAGNSAGLVAGTGQISVIGGTSSYTESIIGGSFSVGLNGTVTGPVYSGAGNFGVAVGGSVTGIITVQ